MLPDMAPLKLNFSICLYSLLFTYSMFEGGGDEN